MAFAYEGCFFGSTWDWNRYEARLNKAGILPVTPAFRYFNDFENDAYTPGTTTTNTVARSGDRSAALDSQHAFALGFADYPGISCPGNTWLKSFQGFGFSRPVGNQQVRCSFAKSARTGTCLEGRKKPGCADVSNAKMVLRPA